MEKEMKKINEKDLTNKIEKYYSWNSPWYCFIELKNLVEGNFWCRFKKAVKLLFKQEVTTYIRADIIKKKFHEELINQNK
jgi:hypothetical protein